MENERVFNYNALVKAQTIDVDIPEGTLVDKHEVDYLIDLTLKFVRIFNRIERMRGMSIDELRIAQTAGKIRMTYTNEVADVANNAFKLVDNPDGIARQLNNLANQSMSMGFKTVRYLVSPAVDILYAQLRSVLIHLVNKNTLYQRHGSDAGYTPFLTTEDCVSILEKTVNMENKIYDAVYTLSNVALASLQENYPDTHVEEFKRRILKYQVFDGEGDAALNVMVKSFDPASRFTQDENEDLIFNFQPIK
jgi:hypothetical protein